MDFYNQSCMGKYSSKSTYQMVSYDILYII